MIWIENAVFPSEEQWTAVIRGMRNPMNSWEKSDSGDGYRTFEIGESDLRLMLRLRDEGACCRKYLRMLNVYADVTAPLYWWKEFDTYKVGTVCNSCSTMHKIHAREFVTDDFSHEHLDVNARSVLDGILQSLNRYRELYVNYDPNDFEIPGCPSKKLIWWQMIQLLPSSYNQKRTVMLNYETLLQIRNWRRRHRLDEWRSFCEWTESLPYAELLKIGGDEDA